MSLRDIERKYARSLKEESEIEELVEEEIGGMERGELEDALDELEDREFRELVKDVSSYH